MRHPLRNHFAAQDYPLRNRGLTGKKAFLCEIISQPKEPSCEIGVLLRLEPPLAKSFHSHKTPPYKNFCSCETTPRHTCAISQPKSPFRSCKMSCETLQSKISQPQAFPCKTTPRHTCAISQPPDSTHGSLALKAYQQNLYLKYYY